MLIAQSCPTFCDPTDCSPPGSSVHGILQARTLEWTAFPSPEDLPDPGIELGSPVLQADSLPFELQGIFSDLLTTVYDPRRGKDFILFIAVPPGPRKVPGT